MTEPSEEVKAMARRILSECEGDPTWKGASLRGERDHTKSFKIALAAILETQRRDAEMAAWAHMVPPDGGSPTPEECALAETIATAIRTCNHYGKAEQ